MSQKLLNLLTPEEVSKILRVSLATVYRMAERKQVRCVRWACPGKNGDRSALRFVPDDIWDFINANTSE